MTPPGLFFAATVMLPAMTLPAEGAMHAASDGALVVGLCNGGSVAIPFANGAPPPATTPCCAAKGCRTGDKRRRIDRKQ